MVVYEPGWMHGFLWVIIVGFIVAFILAFAMGANDCANSYGPAVGSGVLSLRQAYILATIFEVLGAALLGYTVVDTIRSNVVNVDSYNVYAQKTKDGNYSIAENCSNATEKLPCETYTDASFLIGALSSMGGCAIWLLVATVLKMPVSTTHSTIGATVGFSMVLHGTRGIQWMEIAQIVGSWIYSPLLAGFFSTILYCILKFFALNTVEPLENSLRLLPFLFLFTIAVNVFSVLHKGSKYIKLNTVSWWAALIAAVSIGVITAAIVWFFALPRIRTHVKGRRSPLIEPSRIRFVYG